VAGLSSPISLEINHERVLMSWPFFQQLLDSGCCLGFIDINEIVFLGLPEPMKIGIGLPDFNRLHISCELSGRYVHDITHTTYEAMQVPTVRHFVESRVQPLPTEPLEEFVRRNSAPTRQFLITTVALAPLVN